MILDYSFTIKELWDVSKIVATLLGLCSPFFFWFVRKFNQETRRLEKKLKTLEMAIGNEDFLYWIRDEERRIILINNEAVRYFGEPWGKQRIDFIGKRFSDMEWMSPTLVQELDALDRSALVKKDASKTNVEIYPGGRATILKRVRTSDSGSIYIGAAAPQI